MRKGIFNHAFVAAVFFAAASAFAASDNLLGNAGFENGAAADGIPQGWRKDFFVGKPVFGVTKEVHHGGGQSAFIENDTDVVAFLISDPPVPAAPGEKLTVSVWCRAGDLTTSSGGKLIVNAAFIGPEGFIFNRKRIPVVIPRVGEWFEVKSDVTVPPRASAVCLQIGIQQMTGKCWWDDAEIKAEASLAARFHTPNLKFEPGKSRIPVVIINRDPSQRGKIVKLTGSPGDNNIQVHLSDDIVTTATPVFTLNNRGPVNLRAVVNDLNSGRALFVTTQTISVVPELVLEPPLPTHFCIEDSGPPRFEARIQFHENPLKADATGYRYEFRDSAGKLISTGGTAGSIPKTSIEVKGEVLSKDPIGDYTITAMLTKGTQVVTSATQDWHIIHRAQAQVKLGADGNLTVDGKPFYPIGMYMGKDFPELTAMGFNALQYYNMFYRDEGGDQEIKDFLDKVQASGAKALMFISHGFHWRLGMDDTRRRVQMFRNHPAVLVWYDEEAVARGIRPLSWLGELYNLFHKEDPNHPVMEGDERDMSAKIKDRGNMFPDEFLDIATWWWYPIPQRPTANLEGWEGEKSVDGELVPPSFLTQAKFKKPIWVTLQCYKKPGMTDTRFPTEAEYRAMAYIAVIHGSKALMWYTGTGEGSNGIQEHKDEGHWEYFKKLIGELRDMGPVFMAPDAAEQAKAEPTSAPLSLLVKQVGDKRVLLAANRGKKPVKATLEIPGLPKAPVNVRFENRSITPEIAGTLNDNFGEFEVHVYELP